MQQKGTLPDERQAELEGERRESRSREPRPKLAVSITGSLSTLAVLAVLALLHFAASVFIGIFSAILIAIALEPPVKFLCRKTRAPRPVASMFVVFLAVGALYGTFYLAYGSAREFLSDIPTLADRIRTAPIVEQATRKIQGVSQAIEEAGRRFATAPPASKEKPAEVVVRDVRSWEEALFRGLGSLTTVVFSLSFIPFLVYFILADREALTRRTLQLFPGKEEAKVSHILEDIEGMMRKFLVGNAIIAAILSLCTVLLFWAVGLPYWLLLGIVSGVASTIPYLGLILALIPGLIVGLVSFSSGVPLVILVVGVSAFHLVAANLLTPKLVGGRTHLNAVSSTLALMFFGWLWGGMGLLLAIPIAAVLKSVLENIEPTRALGGWLGDSTGEDPGS